MDTLNELKLDHTPLHAHLGFAWDAEPMVVRLEASSGPGNTDSLAFLGQSENDLPPGYAAYFLRDLQTTEHRLENGHPVYSLPRELSYLQNGDILRLNPRRAEAWVMYRRASRHNSLLLTERCNSWCLMCSQPPKIKDDVALTRTWLDAIPLMHPETAELGLTGGEPTLLGDMFFEIVAACKTHLPATALHILSNGRMFNYLSFTQRFADATPSDVMIGIPLYSDLACEHDFIVQAPKAFEQTLRGILNLARLRLPVEVRVVLHRFSVGRLASLAEFICRNLPFVQHVALMGLEPIGFGRANLNALWIDPLEYQANLGEAVEILTNHRMNVSIYNHQLCVLPEQLWPFARQSISDWKNIYLPECGDCSVQDQCGGFFHSAVHVHSRGIRPLKVVNEIATADVISSV